MIRCVRASLFFALGAFSSASFAANIVPNPDFTQWLLGWSFAEDEWIGTMEAEFDKGSPAPPSAHLYGSASNLNSAIATECIAVDASSKIDLSFDTLVLSGSVVGTVIGFSDDACSQSVGWLQTDAATPSADWQTLALHDVELPAGTRFVRVALYARQPAGARVVADAYFDHVAFGPAGTRSTTIPIDQPGLTGAWYDPAESGQGLQFTFDPLGGMLFGTWYTFDTEAGGTDTQRWYSIEGSLASDAVSVDVTIYRNTGGAFDASPATTPTPVGTGTLAFDSCTSGMFEYRLDDGREGSILVQSLHPQGQGNCDETGRPIVHSGPSGVSGTWYDPSKPGQGVMIDVDTFDASVFVGWYTYASGASAADAHGQRWFSAQGSANFALPGFPVQLTVYESTGGTFDAPSPVTTTEVGSATLYFATCESATLDYTFNAGELSGRSGSIPLMRLGAAPESCQLAN
jgi:hypothetical protein